MASAFASSAVAGASAVAHDRAPSILTVEGTVTVLAPLGATPSSVTIQPTNPARPTENVLLDTHTVYRQSGALVTVAALTIGVPVEITLTGSPATAATVRIMSPQPIFVNGTITAISPATGAANAITVKPRDSRKPTVNVVLGAGTLYYSGGVSATISSLTVGAQVHLTATGTPATATTVDIEPTRPIYLSGVVTAVTSTSSVPGVMTVLPRNHHAIAVSIDLGAATVYRQAGRVANAADLTVGSNVSVVASGNPETAVLVRIAVPRPIRLSGTITALNPSAGSLTSATIQPEGYFTTPVTVFLADTTKYTQHGAPVTVSALLLGAHVQLTAKGNPLTATEIHVLVGASDVTLGSVTSVSATQLTVQPQTATSAPITFLLTNATDYYAGRQSSTIAGVNVGDVVRVSAYANAPGTATTVTVRNLVIVGRVTGVLANTISVTGFYGNALSVNVSSATQFRQGGHPSSLAAVLTGDLIAAVGPDVSGVTDSVLASNVWIGTSDNPIFHYAMIQHREAGERHHR